MATVKEGFGIRIHTLGGFLVFVQKLPLSHQYQTHHKPLELLQLLIALGAKEVHKNRISALLWPEAEGDKAHRAFSTNLHRLRSILEIPDALLLEAGCLTLNEHCCWLDIRAFESKLDTMKEMRNHGAADIELLLACLGQAAALYKGPFLGIDGGGAWAVPMRERLRRRFIKRAGEVLAMLKHNHRCADAVGLCENALFVDDTCEKICRQLMICNGALGERSESLHIYEAYCAVLREKNMQPSRELETIANDLQQGSFELIAQECRQCGH